MNKKLTEIAYILDRSGSMQNLAEAAIDGFNTFLKEQQETSGDANLTLALFDGEYLLHADRTAIAEVAELDASTYVPRGCTALLDAIGRTIDNIGTQLAEIPEKDRPGKVIVAIYTDGYENASTDYSVKKISKMIRHQTDKYDWEFLFLAANEDAIATAVSYGIERRHASQVDKCVIGTNASTSSISRMMASKRRVLSGDATEKDLRDSRMEFEQMVREETEKHRKK